MLFFATLLSIVFEPAILLAVSFLAVAVRGGLSFPIACVWMVGLMGPMVLYRLWAKKHHGLDWDMHKREDRIRPFLFLLGYLVIAGGVIWAVEPRLLPLLSLFLFWTLGFFSITAMWTKISGHVGGDMLAIGMIIQWYGYAWWPLMLIVPLVAWARVFRRDHTTHQVLLGFAYSVIILLIYRLFS